MSKYYDYDTLFNTYKAIGLKKNDTIYITGNLSFLGFFKPINKILETHYKAIKKIIGANGTIAFPTFSYSLINSKKIFYIKDTPSETGALTEYLRKKKGSIRQLHPYSSVTSLGKKAKFICNNNSKHAYGYDSPFQKLYELEASRNIKIKQPLYEKRRKVINDKDSHGGESGIDGFWLQVKICFLLEKK